MKGLALYQAKTMVQIGAMISTSLNTDSVRVQLAMAVQSIRRTRMRPDVQVIN
jgi:hypothetical protein